MKKFLFIILLSVSFTAILSDDDDDEKVFYKCSPKNLTSGFCKVGDETYDDFGRKNVTYYLSTCSMGEICTEVDENELVYRCRPKISLLEEGEKCQYDGQCKSRLCLNDTCSHLKDDEVCYNGTKDEIDEEHHYKCGPSSFCAYFASYIDPDPLKPRKYAYKCSPLKKAGDTCKSSYDCPFNHACSFEEDNHNEEVKGKCYQMYSLDVGAETDNKKLCKSGYVYNNKCSNVTIENKCDVKGDRKCIYTYDGVTVENKKCISGLDGMKRYCKRDSNSVEWNSFLNVYNTEISAMVNNTMHVNYLRGNSKFWNNDKVKLAYNKYEYYAETQGGDECALNAYMFVMLSGGFVKFSKFVIFVLTFILL